MNATFVIDTEFNSAGGKLLSLALVGVGGVEDEFYAELPIPIDEPIHPWVTVNVLSVTIPGSTLSWKDFRHSLETFLAKYDAVHIVADWPDDIKYFCESLITAPGERINTPPLTMEIRRDLDAPSKVPHNALWDARAIAELYMQLEGN